jgi:hypothetical protein
MDRSNRSMSVQEAARQGNQYAITYLARRGGCRRVSRAAPRARSIRRTRRRSLRVRRRGSPSRAAAAPRGEPPGSALGVTCPAGLPVGGCLKVPVASRNKSVVGRGCLRRGGPS